MKKSKILLAALTLVGGLTIAGTGFSSWYFQNSVGGASATADVDVTGKHVADATMELTAPGKLSMDDPQFGGGLKWLTTSTTVKEQNTFTAKLTPTSLSNDGASGYTMDFELTITLPTELLTYVSFNSSDNNLLSTDNEEKAGTSTGGVTASTSEVVSYELSGLAVATQDVTLDLTNLLYYTTKVVTTAGKTGTRATGFTESEYDTMKSTLTGKQIKFEAALEFNTVGIA